MSDNDEKAPVEVPAETAEPTSDKSTTEQKDESAQSSLEVTPELEKKIIRQVEYYFSNANLHKDKFLKGEIAKDDGWVSMETMLKFNRLQRLCPNAKIITAALKKSTNNLVEVKEDDSSVRRCPDKPLPEDNEEFRKEMKLRLLYVKGFPTEATLDDLVGFFEEHGGESVQMRYDIKKQFKGSVFVLFNSTESAAKFLEPEEMKYKDTPLLKRMLKEDYFKAKNEERLDSKQAELKKKEEMKVKKEAEEQEEFLQRITRCSVLKVTGIEEGYGIDKLKEFFGKFGKVAWVDFNKGDEAALVRFAAENEAKTAWEAAVAAGTEGKVMLEEKELTATAIEGEEEEKHWRALFQSFKDKSNRKHDRGFRGGGRGGRGRGGHRGGRGGKRERGGGEPAEKRAKVD